MKKKNIYVIAGGTMVHVRPHFALCAPAYGTVGRKIVNRLAYEDPKAYQVIPLFTQMAKHNYSGFAGLVAYNIIKAAGLQRLETNEDLSKLIDYLVSLPHTRCIVLAAAVCDWEPELLQHTFTSASTTNNFGKEYPRLKSRDQDLSLTLVPAEKIVSRIRKGEGGHKDIFLVSFKTTAGLSREQTYAVGLKSLKESSSNLVLANDIKNRHNVVVTPEEFPYYAKNRDDAISNLVDLMLLRLDLDFIRTKVLQGERASIPQLHKEGAIPKNFLPVLSHLINQGAYKPLPWSESTSGHFGCVVEGREFKRISSVRKANHNKCLDEGVSKIIEDTGNRIVAMGAKPSVGEHTQRTIYDQIKKANLEEKAHSIVHFHCPMRQKAEQTHTIGVRSQTPFECGSVQCGTNTALGITMHEKGIWAVHLEGHGPNIAWSKDTPASMVIEFIENNWDLDAKSGGLVRLGD